MIRTGSCCPAVSTTIRTYGFLGKKIWIQIPFLFFSEENIVVKTALFSFIVLFSGLVWPGYKLKCICYNIEVNTYSLLHVFFLLL